MFNGLPLPLDRLRSQVGNHRWRTLLRFRTALAHRLRVLAPLVRSPAESIQTIIREGTSLRKVLMRKLTSLANSDLAVEYTRRHWLTQKIRKRTVQLFQLLPLERYKEIDSILPSAPEYEVARAVTRTLSEQRIEYVQELPGPPVAATANLWRQHYLSPVAFPGSLSEFAPFEAAVHLALAGVIVISTEQRNSVVGRRKAFLSVASGTPGRQRALSDHSFEDELQSLALSRSWAEITTLYASNAAEHEPVELDLDGLDGWS